MYHITDHLTQDFLTHDIPRLLASDTPDASKGALFGSGQFLSPNPTARIMLLGLGGAGVKTLDRIKGAVVQQVNPSWRGHVAFLAMDADYYELKHTRYLSTDEKLCITLDNATQRAQNPNLWTEAQRGFMPENVRWRDLEFPGSGCTRLMGKFKLYDQLPGDLPVDAQIVARLQEAAARKLRPLPGLTPNETYDVIVIGSICGGTGAGIVTEIPALLQRALRRERCRTTAMLYLPDVMVPAPPVPREQFFANAYATLKELDYYQGGLMRDGYRDSFPSNDPAQPTVQPGSPDCNGESLYETTLLLGNPTPGISHPFSTVMEAAEQFVLFRLTQQAPFPLGAAPHNVPRLYSDPATKIREAYGHNHDRPKVYTTMGCAEAAAPEKLLRVYAVAKALENMGLAPVSPDRRDEMLGQGVSPLPFLGLYDPMPARDGTARAAAMVEPVAKLLQIVHSTRFDLESDLGITDITWEKIRNGEYDTKAFRTMVEHAIDCRTKESMAAELDKAAHQAWLQFRKNVQDYVEEFGPLAFVNLYHGRFSPAAHGDPGLGVKDMLRNLCSGKTATGGVCNDWRAPVDTGKVLGECRYRIDAMNGTPLSRVFQSAQRKTQRDMWVDACNRWIKSRIDQERRNYALTEAGIMWKQIGKPASLLCGELEAFGHILVCLADGYRGMAQPVESFHQFSNAVDHPLQVNAAGVHPAVYDWLKQQADVSVSSMNPGETRRRLIDQFFRDPQKWLRIPEERILALGNGHMDLRIPELAIPAREEFDRFMAEELPAMGRHSLGELFEAASRGGVSYDETANFLVHHLFSRSRALLNSSTEVWSGVFTYPNSLHTEPNGNAVASALSNAVHGISHLFPHAAPSVLCSGQDACLRMFQFSCPFELYQIAALPYWESMYHTGLCHPDFGLHGASPDPSGEISWADYPAITLQQDDPRLRDPNTGILHPEGKRRREMDIILGKARELGVLFSEQTPDGWIVKRFHCDKTILWDKFQVRDLPSDPKTHLPPLGKELAQAVARHHGKTLEEVTRPVLLTQGGILETPRPTEEMAWEAARRVLYAHMPMFLEVRDTQRRFDDWVRQILAANGSLDS